jgi:hypothetical protein
MSNWMPIETAPKDKKTIVRLLWEDDGAENVGMWAYSPNAGCEAWGCIAHEAPIFLPYKPQPSHWQPITPPTQKAGANE